MQTTVNEVIKELSSQLNVTIEHLWGVLVTQAPISATIELGMLVIAWYVVYRSFGIIRDKTTKKEIEDKYFKCAEWEDEIAILAWALLIVSAVNLAVITAVNLPNIISGFINPEYWALKQII